MNNSGYTAGRGRRPAVPDKVDMSLDDIIRLNRKEQQLKRRQATMNRRPVRMKGRLPQGKGVPPGAAGPAQRGGAPKQRNRRVPQLRLGQGVITGLAARRPGALLKRVGTLNRAAISQKTRQKTRPFIQHTEAQYRKPEGQRWLNRQPYPQRGHNVASVRRPFQLRRRPLPPVQQMRRDARQATFLFRRGLNVHGVYVWTPGEVQAQAQKQNPHTPPVRTRQWRTSTASNGILTVSIDNPTARTQPEPPTAWTLHPPASISAPLKMETEEKKIPKGVPLQFDINSVGKPQTSMTLNDRFRILKDQRTTTAQSSKGSRFVTVG